MRRRQTAPFANDRPQGRSGRPGQRAGAEYGRHGCRPRPAQHDDTRAAPIAKTCPECSRAVAVTRLASQYQEGLPVVRSVVRSLDVEAGHCTRCQRRMQGHHDLQIANALRAAGVQLGPAVVALVVELHTEMGVPLAKVAHLLRTTFGLQVTPGGLAHVLHRAARAAAPTYTELREQVRTAPVVTPDETGWRVGGERHWLWTFVTPETTVYAICPGRGVRRCCHGVGDRLPRRARARRMGAVSLLRRTAPELSESLCRCRDYSDVGADAPVVGGICTKPIGIITALRERPGARRMVDSGPRGRRLGWPLRAPVPSGRGRHGCRCRWCVRVRVRATGR